MARNYRKEYDNYHARPKQRQRRSERNQSRREAKKRGMKVDGKDVDHKNHNTSDKSPGNLRVQSKKVNRSRNRPGTGNHPLKR